MKKLFKTAASLTVGCALLSTSAFAALTGEVVKTDTGATVKLTGYAEKAQSTILVLKDVDELSADIADSAIAYINQAEATNGTITYDVKVSGDGTYSVFVGGSDQTEAKKLESFVISSVVPTTGITLAIEGLTADANGNFATELTVGDTLTVNATVAPDNATDKTVTWTSSNADVATVEGGVVTTKAAGDVVITATAGSFSKTVTIKVNKKAPDAVYLPGANGTVEGVGTVVVKNITAVNQKWWNGFANGSRKVKVTLDALKAADAVTANYVIEVVKASDPEVAIEAAEVYYSTEGKFFIALIPAANNADYQFKVVNGENVNNVTAIAKFGEVNGRVGVNVLDAAQMSKIALGTAANTLTTNAAVIAADVDNNANLNVSDAATIAKKALGNIANLPILE